LCVKRKPFYALKEGHITRNGLLDDRYPICL